MAILGNSKRFIRSPSVQKVIGKSCNTYRGDRELILWRPSQTEYGVAESFIMLLTNTQS